MNSQQYAMCLRRFRKLEKLLIMKRFRRLSDPVKRPGKVKIYTEEEVFLFKVRRCASLLNST